MAEAKMKGYLILTICLIISSTAFISAVVSTDDTTIIRVGLYENPPKIFTDASGNISGFWPDIIGYIASEEGWEVEYVHGNWSECLQRLEKGEIDIMPDVAFSEGRNKLYDFSNEIVLVSWSIVYTRKGLDMQSIIDLKGKTIAVLNGSVNSDGPGGIKELVRKFDINCAFMEMGSYTEVFEALESGEADAGVTNRDFGGRHESQFDVKKTPIIFQPVDLKFAFPKNASMNPYLIERIDYHIRELKNDSSSIYYKSIGKYLENAVVEEEVVVFPVWAKDALYIASTVSIFLLLLYILSRMQVKRKTTELKESEEKYRTLIENANDGICIIKDGLMVFANPRLLEMGGYSEQDVINQPFSKFISEESLKEVVDKYKK
ncbi:MAG TPA: transporter substrate-binding domain-containing protein, partial [Thermoplasmatales archaeon]|nr:transporter substrate-binding domain-containing protein [Thermoplasmatales archaeon]